MPTEASYTNNNQSNTDSARTYLIKGDISGIQGFIFNVKSDGAARSLKGRSFFLKILLEVGMRLVFDQCDIPDDKRKDAEISTSGGNFILKLEGDNIIQKISEIQATLTESLQYIGLDMMLCAVPWTGNFSRDKKQLNQVVRERKLQLLEGCDVKAFFEPFSKEKIRNTYGMREKKDWRDEGKHDNNWTDITTELKEKNYFEIEKNSTDNKLQIEKRVIYFAGYKVSFSEKKQEGKRQRLDTHLEKVFPISHKRIITFEQLVKNGDGIAKLGVLAMDVDNLGTTIEDIADESDHKEFDRELREFFNNKLKKLIEEEKEWGRYWDERDKKMKWGNVLKYKNKVYTVTAGGDDSFFVGKWNVMLKLAIDIKTKFEEYFKERIKASDRIDINGQSKKISISAALLIVHPKFPVVRFAELAEEALKNAKYKYPDSKGNISIFGEVVKWNFLEGQIGDIREALQPVDEYEDKYGKIKQKRNQDKVKAISGGLLARVRFNTLKALDDSGMRLSQYWELAYFMRNYGGDGQEVLGDYRYYLEQSTSEKYNDLEKRNYKLILPIATRLVELDNRK